MWRSVKVVRKLSKIITSKWHCVFIIIVMYQLSKLIKMNVKSDKHDTAYIIYPINFIQRKETVQEDSLDRMKLVEEFIPNVKVETVSCSAIIRGDLQEITKGTVVKSRTSKVEYYLNIAKNCSKFVNQRKYSIKPLSEEEASFPIAFSLLVYKNVEQVERLLRAIYRPQNYYCIHVDLKSQDAFKEAMKGIVSCFPNVFLASKMVSITWGKPSVLEPELICMRDLWNYTTWKYYINLTGQEFPLRTNGELVEILRTMNGANIVEGTIKKRFHHYRITKPSNDPLITSLRLTKGSVHVAVQRGFVDYILHNETASKFLDWVKTTIMPEETFFTTLSHNPQLNIPGSYLGLPESGNVENKDAVYPYLGRFVNWGENICHGRKVRMVCVFGVGDLHLLSTRKQLFLNKFDLHVQPVAFDCMEELHFNRTREYVLGLRTFNISYYQNLDLVKNHIK